MMNLFSVEARRNPFPLYEQFRKTTPVLAVPPLNLWMIFDYDGVRRALYDHESFGNSLLTAGRGNPDWLIFFDPPRHLKLRALIARAFTPSVVANLEPRIRVLSRDLLNQHLERGAMDLAGDYGVPLPMMVIAEMIGIPTADWARFRSWSDSILKLSFDLQGGPEAEKGGQEFRQVTAEMRSYLASLIAQRRESPREDLLTRLMEAEVDGERLKEEEILGFFQLLLVAGQETTANLINNAVLCFLEYPDQLTRLRQQPELLPLAIEEVLRFRAPLQFVLRATRRPVEMHGQKIPAGELVLPVIGSANRDSAQFRNPDQFDVQRAPNPHLSFGSGIHACLGAPLSRLEARIALTHLLEGLQEPTLDSDQPWEPRQALHVHGPARLPIRFRPGRQLQA